MTWFMLEHIQVREHILKEEKYKYLFSVELVNQLVLEGMPFRDAYVEVGRRIADGEFKPSGEVHHTHEGSIGNLCNDEIKSRMEAVFEDFKYISKQIESRLSNRV